MPNKYEIKCIRSGSWRRGTYAERFELRDPNSLVLHQSSLPGGELTRMQRELQEAFDLGYGTREYDEAVERFTQGAGFAQEALNCDSFLCK